MRALAAVSLSTVFALGASAQQVADLGEMLAPIRRQHNVPALGVAVLQDGALSGLGVVGLRKVGDPTEVSDSDRWHLGSCTKAMTATWLAMLVDDGDLAWETTVAVALPDLASSMHPSAREVSLASLLWHRSGLPASPPAPLWARLFRYDGSDGEARLEVARALLAAPLEAAPGARFLYSNAGYMIAGAVGEAVVGSSWQQQMRARLFDPLGMSQTGFGPPGDEAAVDHPWGHVVRDGERQPVFFDNPSSLGPAGTVHASLKDWAKFAALHLQIATEGGILSERSRRRLRAPPRAGRYAHGWMVTERRWAPGPVLTHTGSNTLWFCVAWLAPEAGFGVLVTCNQGDAAAACDAVAAACVRRFRD